MWTLTREMEEGGEFSPLEPTRYLSAYGRDVELQPEALAFELSTRRLVLTGKGKAEMKASRVVDSIREVMADGSRLSRSRICDLVGGKRQTVWDAVGDLIASGDIQTTDKGKSLYWPDAVEVPS